MPSFGIQAGEKLATDLARGGWGRTKGSAKGVGVTGTGEEA